MSSHWSLISRNSHKAYAEVSVIQKRANIYPSRYSQLA